MRRKKLKGLNLSRSGTVYNVILKVQMAFSITVNVYILVTRVAATKRQDPLVSLSSSLRLD